MGNSYSTNSLVGRISRRVPMSIGLVNSDLEDVHVHRCATDSKTSKCFLTLFLDKEVIS